MSSVSDRVDPNVPPVAPAEPRGKLVLLAAVLVAAALISYANSFTAPFIFDDQNWIVHYRQLENLPEDLRKLRVANRPLIHLSVALNYALAGLDVRGYHLLNLAVHIMAGLTLFGIVRWTVQIWNQRRAQDLPATSISFAVALLWLVHPLHTGSVTYLIQRCESMMGMFFLLCLYCVIRGSQARRGRPWYVASVVACVLGLGCKEVMVTAPPVVLLYDRVFLCDSWREVFRRRGWVHGLLWGAVLVFVAILLPKILGGAGGTVGFAYQALSPLEYLRSQPGVILHYLRLAFWPRSLCLDYLWPPATLPAEIYPPAAVIVGLLIGSLVALRYRPWLGFLGLAFFLILAPTSSMMPIADLAFEHRMYLPLASVVVLLVLALYSVTRRFLRDPAGRRLAQVGTLVVAATALAALTCERNADYGDPVRIWSKVLEISPHNWRAHSALAEAYRQRGDVERERHHYEQALAAKPDHERLHVSMAACLARADDLDGAEFHYRRAVELKPDYVQALLDGASLFQRRQKWDQAMQAYRRVLQVRPDHADAQRNLAFVLWRTGRIREAVPAYRRLLELRPEMAGIKAHLAKILATSDDAALRNGAEALQLAEEARRALGETDYRVLDALGAAYAALGRYDDACRAVSKSLELARSSGKEEKCEELKSRLELYQSRKPYRSTPTQPAAIALPSDVD